MRGELLLLLADGLAILCLARCLLQWVGLGAAHPLSRFCIQTTEWLIRPLRKIIPTPGKWDSCCLIAVLLLYYFVFMIITFLAMPSGFGAELVVINFLFAFLHALKAVAYMLLIGLIARMISSFSQPYSALSAAMQQIFEPILRPLAFLRLGNIDFSGSVLALVLWFWLSYLFPILITRLNLWLLK